MKKYVSEFSIRFKDQSGNLLLFLFLCADLTFILIHCINKLGHFNYGLLYISEDQSYPEMFQYLKFFWIALILFNISHARKSYYYISWTLVFVYFLLDDAFAIHEKIGHYLISNLDFIPTVGPRLQDWGELSLTIAFGFILGLIITWAYLRGDRTFKKVSQDLILLVIILSFFGVILDIGIYFFHTNFIIRFIFGTIEDSGEMLVTTLILWYVFLTYIRGKSDQSYLIDYFRFLICLK